LVLTALHAASNYRVGGLRFPSAHVTARDIASVLADAGMSTAESSITVARVSDDRDHGFDGVILAMSRRLLS
jgi:purine nucleoside permease